VAMTLVPFSLTYVRYEEDDLIGKILSLFTLSPVFIMVMYATILVIRRDIQTVFITFGQLINVGANLILKKIINDPRPQERLTNICVCLPSSHLGFCQ
jgi:dolichyldiphosphatase